MNVNLMFADQFIKMIFGVFIWTSVTVVWTRGEIFDFIKQAILHITPWSLEEYVATLLYCAQCSGFWVGIIGGIIIIPEWIHNIGGPVIQTILHGFCISLSSTIVDKVIYGRNKD